MNSTKLTIIIPAYNEAENIAGTLETLVNQVDMTGNPLDKSLYRIVVVNNNSTDETELVMQEIIDRHKDLKIFLINSETQGVVPARIAGYDFVLNNRDICTKYLASGDADIMFHENWVASTIETFEKTGAAVISNAGCFPRSFWIKVPNLVERYLSEVGTIFFDQSTINHFNLQGQKYLFTEQIFFAFTRPVTDGCFAITKDAYLRAGGYTREFEDLEKTKEVFGEGWRLVFQLERKDAGIIYSNRAPYNSNPRRLLQEPQKFLGTVSYDGEMVNLRYSSMDDYERLNEYAKYVDLEPVQRYVVGYYIFLKCITRPQLIHQNPQYFGNLADEIYSIIEDWWQNRKDFAGNDLFKFSKELENEYFSKIMQIIPEQEVK